jgi:hypothetical protein
LFVFASHHKNDNTLFGAINEDAQVLSFQADVRALGIVSKLVTWRFGRELEKDMHVLDLVPKYKQMCEKF